MNEEWEKKRSESIFRATLTKVLLRYVIQEISRVYWNIHQEKWGTFFGEDEAQWHPIVLGDIRFEIVEGADQDQWFNLFVGGWHISDDAIKPWCSPYVESASALSEEDIVSWFRRSLEEIHRIDRDHFHRRRKKGKG